MLRDGDDNDTKTDTDVVLGSIIWSYITVILNTNLLSALVLIKHMVLMKNQFLHSFLDGVIRALHLI
jgi:hypothetical protein